MPKKRVLPDEDCFRWEVHAELFYEKLASNPPIPRGTGSDPDIVWTSYSSDAPERARLFQINTEISGILGLAITKWLEQKLDSKGKGGRPPDLVTPFLGQRLLSIFLEYHDKAARLSVAIGKTAQAEGGPFFEYIARAIAPLNRFFASLPEAYGAPQISPTQVARRALRDLAERRSVWQESSLIGSCGFREWMVDVAFAPLPNI